MNIKILDTEGNILGQMTVSHVTKTISIPYITRSTNDLYIKRTDEFFLNEFDGRVYIRREGEDNFSPLGPTFDSVSLTLMYDPIDGSYFVQADEDNIEIVTKWAKRLVK